MAGSLRTAVWDHGFQASAPYPVDRKETIVAEGRIEEILDRSEDIRLILERTEVRKVGENGDVIHSGGRWYVYLKPDVAVECTRVEDLLPGQRILITGTIMLPEAARNEGEFAYDRFCRAYGIRGSVFPKLIQVTDTRSAPVPSFFLNLRRTAMRALSLAPEEDFGLLAAVLVGNRSFVSEGEYDDFTQAGAGHILSISGIHLSILCYGFFRLLRSLRTPISVRALLPVGLVWFYALFAGLPVSALRASIMFTIMMGGELLGRRYDIRSSMSAALLILLAARPGYLLLTGMQYSFAALFGICFVVPAAEVCLGERFHPAARKAFAGYLGVFLVTLPLQCLNNFEFSPYSILFNGVLIPCMGLLLGTGFLGVAAGAFAKSAGLLFRIPHLILVLYRIVSSLPDILPFGMILTGRPTVLGLCFYVAAGVLIFLLSYRKKKSRYLVLLVVMPLFLLRPTPSATRIDVLDVGQGSCAVLRTTGGKTVMIDCGSTDRKNLAEYTLIPYLAANRIGRIDLAVVSHMDFDHMDGFRQLAAAQFPIGRSILTDRAAGSEEMEQFEELMKRNGAVIRHAGAGDVLFTARRGEKEQAALSVVAPEHGAIRAEENEYSLVLSYCEGMFSMLFPGDLGESGEERTGASLDITPGGVLLAGHHGSMYSTGETFLLACRPSLTIFSAGKGNSYGHPHPQTLERVRRAGSADVCTIDTGQVTITVRKGKFTVKFFKGGLRKEEQ